VEKLRRARRPPFNVNQQKRLWKSEKTASLW